LRESTEGPGRTAIPLLLLGAAIGVGLAAAGLLRGDARGGSLPDDVAARVNGQVIRRDEYQRILNGVAQERRDGMTPEVAQRILDRLIEEELLVQRALELGLARVDNRVRKDLTTAMIESIVAEADNEEPSPAEVDKFYQEHLDFFRSPDRLHVRQIWCRAATVNDANVAFERAQQAAQRLRNGEEFRTVQDELGDSELAPLPDTYLPLGKLADYLGPTALRTVQTLNAGQVSDPVRSTSGYHVLQLVGRQSDAARSVDEIRPQVLQEMRRNAADRALRAYIDDLKAQADIEIAKPQP